MIVIVAPYSPPNRPGNSHLGASRKIEIIISILSKLNKNLILINSAHNTNQKHPTTIATTNIAGVKVTEITPETYENRSIGKLKNILSCQTIIKKITEIGPPSLFWFYNGYSFEMAIALTARKKFKCPMILELEDWHFSRSRGLNPKPYLDFLLWRLAAPKMNGSFSVNNSLNKKMEQLNKHSYLLPGVVPQRLNKIAKNTPPFRNPERVDIGYFGGLSKEKGADIVLELASLVTENFHIHVTGSGELSNSFIDKSKSIKNLHYYGRVDDETLYSLIEKCDILLNPHTSIKDMGNGIFPFKVVEAIASGRVLISTSIPTENLEDVVSSTVFVNRTTKDFLSAINNASIFYSKNHESIRAASLLADKLFGEASILSKVNSIISN